MTKDELIAEITTLRQIVAMGYDRLAENQYLDMDLMQSKVDAACQEVAEMSPDEAAEIRQVLMDLLANLQEYSSRVSEHVDRNQSASGDGPAQG